MSKRKPGRRFSPEFKARVGIEAARGVKTVNEIAEENELHPVRVSQWKKETDCLAGFIRDGKRPLVEANNHK